MKKEMEELESLNASIQHMQDASQKEDRDRDGRKDKGIDSEKAVEAEMITIDDFAKLDLRVVKVLEAERVEGSNKLLKLKVEMGKETRQVVSGIAKHYAPESLVGKSVILVANLKPARLKGIESQGMILAAVSDNKLTLATLDDSIDSGAKVN